MPNASRNVISGGRITSEKGRGIGVSSEDGRVVIDLHVVVEQGINMSSVSDNLVSSVKFILKKIAELDDVKVRVHIEGMRTRA